MKKFNLKQLIFLALCCDLGLFSKKIIGPFANIITDSLHIPGGISTAFSLMFLTVGASLLAQFGSAIIMGSVQSVLALAFGMVGSMGVLAPIGYILPGVVIDLFLWITRSSKLDTVDKLACANALAAVTASATANLIVFHLRGLILWLYLGVSCTSGAVCGLLGGKIAKHLKRTIIQPTKEGVIEL